MTATLPPLPENWVGLTDADRDRALQSQPDMLDGFMKTWGWLHFAKAIEAICAEKNGALAAIAAQAQPSPIVVQPDFYVRSVDTVWINKPNFNSVSAMLWSKSATGRVPCYLATSAAVLAVQPTPLTDAQLEALWPTTFAMPQNQRLLKFARAIELAHGISAPVVTTLTPGDAK